MFANFSLKLANVAKAGCFVVRKKISDLSFKIIIAVVTLVIFISVTYWANAGFSEAASEQKQSHETARVTEILATNVEMTENGFYQGEMRLIVELETGAYRGAQTEVVFFLNQITSHQAQIDDRMSVRITVVDEVITSINIQNPERREIVFGFFAVFLVILGLLGGKRGIIAITSLIFTLISIIFLLIPLALRGYSVIFTTFIILFLITIVSLTLLAGFTSKGIAAMIGCLIGVAATAILTHIGATLAHISGFHMEEVGLILATTDIAPAQASGLFISGVLIASLGAVMDTAMTIASTVDELRKNNPKMTVARLFRSGMNVGRDTMGTMTATLILAFAGTSLNMIILIYNGGTSLNQLINSDFIVIEIIRSIAGSLGIILTIPAVALVSSVMD